VTAPTEPDLAELARLEAAATKGPWFVDALDSVYVGNRADGRTSGLWAIVYASGDKLDDLTPEAQKRVRTDAEFIAAARNALPWLLAQAAMAERMRALFAGGPDTPCRTVWDEGIECVSVPMADLAAALGGALPETEEAK
jgi:hypothetical protein